MVANRWPDAFVPAAAFDDEGHPSGHLIYPLLATPTKDGHFIQFAQTEPRLFLALMKELDLMWMFTDPKWAGLPQLYDAALRIELWEIMLERASARGAKVIKVEPLDGDTIRGLVPFPEAGGAKVMQGKESIALDMRSPEGLAIVHQLARQADVVLQTYRAGAAVRAAVDARTSKALNPDLVYLCAPGYGTDGPYGARPAYAPSIGAATGLALTDMPDMTEGVDTLDQVNGNPPRRQSFRACGR
ncbi:CoA transferase [Nocardia pseudovaccinii]|uniref:CoA transferase n=1 Tax=Nocardia pseudovaccinii TaxID=189540 RepID=UPI0012F4EF85|nr:CoA transferase [Nocardia pseudovaccinii]